MRERLPIGVSGGPGVEPSNRLFIIITIGLVGMLVLGLVGIGGYAVFSRARRAMVPTPTVLVEKPPETPTRTSTPTYTLTFTPTKTPTRTPTYTPVVLPPTSTPVIGATPTAIEVAVTSTPNMAPPGETTPVTGFGIGALGVVGVILAALLIFARRVRLTS